MANNNNSIELAKQKLNDVWLNLSGTRFNLNSMYGYLGDNLLYKMNADMEYIKLYNKYIDLYKLYKNNFNLLVEAFGKGFSFDNDDEISEYINKNIKNEK